MIRLAAIIAVIAVSAQASERPAPEYFVDAVMATTTARQLALACPQVSINLPVISVASGKVMAQLEQDGFDTSSDTLGMIDPVDEITKRQQAFMARHNLKTGAATRIVCDAAKAEISQSSKIGTYLLELKQ